MAQGTYKCYIPAHFCKTLDRETGTPRFENVYKGSCECEACDKMYFWVHVTTYALLSANTTSYLTISTCDNIARYFFAATSVARVFQARSFSFFWTSQAASGRTGDS